MPAHLVFSGPSTHHKRAQKVLPEAGYRLVTDRLGQPVTDSYGHDATAGLVWLTVEGSEPDRAITALSGTGWRLRAQRHVPDPAPQPSARAKLAALGLTAADLRSILEEG